MPQTKRKDAETALARFDRLAKRVTASDDAARIDIAALSLLHAAKVSNRTRDRYIDTIVVARKTRRGV